MIVFINYRRQDSDASAGRLYDTLTKRMRDSRIFMDVDGIRPGQDFTRVLASTLSSTDVMLSVIGPKWIGLQNEDGTRRLDEPDDFVTMEIAEALSRNVFVVPVLVQGAKMPGSDELPERIRALAKRQAIALSGATWNDDSDALARHLESAIGEAVDGGDEQTGRSWFGQWRRRVLARAARWRVVKGAAIVLLGMAVLAGGYVMLDFFRHREQRAVEAISRNLRYELSREVVLDAIEKLQERAARSTDAAVVDDVTNKLKSLVVVHADTTDNGRAIRTRALQAIKTLRLNDLTRDFGGNDFVKSDLVDADLSRATIKGLNLSGSFLLRTTFEASDLTGANLSGTWVRNAHFAAATLTGANIGKMDWFNADGFAPNQLKSVNLATLEHCPKDESLRPTEAAFRARLDRLYAFKWERMGSDRDQLLKVWTNYAKPGGLCEQVDQWLASR